MKTGQHPCGRGRSRPATPTTPPAATTRTARRERARLRLRIVGASSHGGRTRSARRRTEIRRRHAPSIPRGRAKSSGRRASAKAASTAACSGAWRVTAEHLRVGVRRRAHSECEPARPGDTARFMLSPNQGGGTDGAQDRRREQGLVGRSRRRAAPVRRAVQPRAVGRADGHARTRLLRIARRPSARARRRRRTDRVGCRHRARLRHGQRRQGARRIASTAPAPSSPAACCSSTPATRASTACRATLFGWSHSQPVVGGSAHIDHPGRRLIGGRHRHRTVAPASRPLEHRPPVGLAWLITIPITAALAAVTLEVVRWLTWRHDGGSCRRPPTCWGCCAARSP